MATNRDAPLVSAYVILPQITLRTTVWGRRSMVTVTILSGSEQLWAGLLTPAEPTATVPVAIPAGDATLEPGMTFTLTAGRGFTEGSVSVTAVVQSGGATATLRAVVATWKDDALRPALAGAGTGADG
jgi:hypothetical protein